jgi:hypothetical protein
MPLDERRRRPPPLRTDPVRSVFPAAGAAPASSPARVEPVRGASATSDSAIGAAVRAAYDVVDQNVLEGRRAAERLRAAASPVATAAPDPRSIANRLMHISRDMGAAWIELAVAVLKEPEVRAVLDRLASWPPAASASAPSPAPASAVAGEIVQRISCRRPIEVTLSPLPARITPAPPGIAGLHALDPALPPIRQVRFGLRPGGGLELRIDIPDDQPPGAYSGTIVDVDSLQPIGTLAVRVVE